MEYQALNREYPSAIGVVKMLHHKIKTIKQDRRTIQDGFNMANHS